MRRHITAYPMKSYREELWFETKTRRAYINITPQVETVVQKSGVREGLVLVNAMHITASVYINDDASRLLQDYDEFLERQVVPVTEAVRMALGDDITESFSKLALLHYAAAGR